MNKLIRDGKIAVLYSPGYGAGWYTWNTDHPECLYDPEMVKIVLGEAEGNIKEIAKRNYGDDFYPGGLTGLTVEWIPIGHRFCIEEFDGSENLIVEGIYDGWLVAEEE